MTFTNRWSSMDILGSLSRSVVYIYIYIYIYITKFCYCSRVEECSTQKFVEQYLFNLNQSFMQFRNLRATVNTSID
jgi:hypothetical protein